MSVDVVERDEKREPETEEEYWEVIEALGGLIWSMRHSVHHGRESNPGATMKSAMDLQAQIERYVQEACDKFNIIHPHNPPEVVPEGATPYWEWYHGMKAQIFGREYDQSVCSSCAFATSRESHCQGGGSGLPCSLFSGWMRFEPLPASHRCEIVYWNASWNDREGKDYHPKTNEELFAKLLLEHGQEASDRMRDRLVKAEDDRQQWLEEQQSIA